MSRKMLLSVKNLTISHLGRPIVDKLSLSVSSGELVALIGANGCGKTTLLSSLQAKHARDEAYFAGNDFVLSGHIDFPSGLSLIRLPQNLRKELEHLRGPSPGSESIRLEHRLRAEFNFDAEHDDPDRLSDGQLQKLALIRTLSAEADLMLLDEPSNYLDIDGLTAFESNVQDLKARGRGFLLISHDRTFVENVAHQLYLLQAETDMLTKRKSSGGTVVVPSVCCDWIGVSPRGPNYALSELPWGLDILSSMRFPQNTKSSIDFAYIFTKTSQKILTYCSE